MTTIIVITTIIVTIITIIIIVITTNVVIAHSFTSLKTLRFHYFLGIGIAMMVISYLVSIYYNVIICWALVYLVSSFASEVPWKECNPDWASDRCR
jgi:SNF family Na+-dependent transporter